MHPSWFRIGDCAADLPAGWEQLFRDFLEYLPPRLKEYNRTVMQNVIFKVRTKDNSSPHGPKRRLLRPRHRARGGDATESPHDRTVREEYARWAVSIGSPFAYASDESPWLNSPFTTFTGRPNAFSKSPAYPTFAQIVRFCNRSISHDWARIADRDHVVTPAVNEPIRLRHHALREQIPPGIELPRHSLAADQRFYVRAAYVDYQTFHEVSRLQLRLPSAAQSLIKLNHAQELFQAQAREIELRLE